MGNLLFKKEVKHETREAIIMLLAHQSSEIALTILVEYSLALDKDLEYFAKIALDECAMWNGRNKKIRISYKTNPNGCS